MTLFPTLTQNNNIIAVELNMTVLMGNLRVTAPPPSQTPSPQPSPRNASQQPPMTPTTQSCTTPVTPPLSSLKKVSKHRPSVSHSKNLRWTAIALVEKLSTQHERPSSVVADEVALAASADLQKANPDRSAAAVERNTRRRVYDALKVMEAAGCIHRDGKNLRWIGVAELARAAARVGDGLNEVEEERAMRAGEMKVEICTKKRRIIRKRNQMREMRHCVDNFERFVEMRKRNASTAERLQFPFTLVKCEGMPDIEKDGDCLSLGMEGKFRMYTETDVVNLLAEKGKLGRRGRKRKVKEVKTPAPPPPSPQKVEPIEEKTEEQEEEQIETETEHVKEELGFVKEEEEYFEELQKREELKRNIFIHGLHEGVEPDPDDPELEVGGREDDFEEEVELEDTM